MTSDKQLVEIERKVEALRLEIRERERRLNERIDKLIAERQAEKKKKEEAKKLKMAKDTQISDNTTPSNVVGTPDSSILVKEITQSPCELANRTIDQKLGAFYGSSELKDAIKDAQAKMHITIGSLQKVREHSHTPFVRKEIEHLYKTVGVLTQIFNRMLDRMELPNDGEEFFLDDILHK